MKTPWQKIMRAYVRGTGLRLTVEEINRLGRDGAIETRASLDDDDEGIGFENVKAQTLQDR